MTTTSCEPDVVQSVDTAPNDSIVISGDKVGRRLPHITVGEFTEAEIFGAAPVWDADRVHWTLANEVVDIPDVIAHLSMPAFTRQWSDGISRVWVAEGSGDRARQEIREYFEVRDLTPHNLRIEAGVPFRNLELIPTGQLEGLLAEAAAWLMPRTQSIQSKVVAELDGVDQDDMLGLIYLFCSDIADRFDDRRDGRNGGLNFLAFAWGKLRNWPLDLARTRYGRSVLNDRIVLGRLAESMSTSEGRTPTEFEKAEALGVSVTDMRRREITLNTLASARYADAAFSGVDDHSVEFPVGDGVDISQTVELRAIQEKVAEAIMAAVAVKGSDPQAISQWTDVDPLALTAVYLSFWEDMSRADIARLLNVTSRVVNSALSRAQARMDVSSLR